LLFGTRLTHLRRTAVASTVFTSRFDSLVADRTALPEALTGG
jgi:hypothetical protein